MSPPSSDARPNSSRRCAEKEERLNPLDPRLPAPSINFALVPGAIDVEHRGRTDIARAVTDSGVPTASAGYERMMRGQGELIVQLFADRGLFEGPTG